MKILLINKDNPMPEDYKPQLAEICDGYMLEREACASLKRMMCFAMCDGVCLHIFSAYSSPEYQRGIFDEDVARYKLMGYSQEEAAAKTALSIAPPFYSEHNAGLAVDISTPDWKGEITEEFENTMEFKWLSKNACKYGFILRYPRGSESITGISYEPWHYRYVGLPHSKIIACKHITLEEYLT